MIARLLGPGRLSYRRLVVWSVGTGLLMAGYIDSEQWLYLALAYIGGDSLSAWRTAR